MTCFILQFLFIFIFLCAYRQLQAWRHAIPHHKKVTARGGGGQEIIKNSKYYIFGGFIIAETYI